MTVEYSSGTYIIEGKVEDKEGSEKIYLRVDGRPFDNIKDDGSFKIKRHSNKSEEVWITAFVDGGSATDFLVNVKISTNEFTNDKKYYALIIGKNKFW